ncbi:MAG: guanylate kinase [Bacteroidetes bacterium HGW-Bacteroidetes-12]|nr:MAG: guanylate kinase [Bacteroidetes bacterium HGW-Bacteroidetes-12]
MKEKLIIFSAPSGAGKTTIIHALLEKNLPLGFSISACSRPLRNNEKHGIDYYFLSPEDFRQKIKNKEFLEWEEVYHDNYYGTLFSEVERIWKTNKSVVFDIDVIGGLNIKKVYPKESLSIFIMPPSIEILKERLLLRETETIESLKKRISKAKEEISYAKQFDRIIINDDLEKAIEETTKIVQEFTG